MIVGHPRSEMVAVWSEQRRCAIMLPATEAMESLCEVPQRTAASRAGAAPLLPNQFPLACIGEIEATVKRDVIAFLTACNEVIGELGRFLHMGMTSSDVLDTALAVQIKDAGELILATLDGVLVTLERRSREHTHTIGMGRSRVRIARAIDDVAVGRLSGAGGTFAHRTQGSKTTSVEPWA
jgi:adenylosuccinate lyase